MTSQLDKLIDTRLKKIIKETSIFTSSDGTAKTLPSDQKMKAKKAADNGDSISIRKRGDEIKEGDDILKTGAFGKSKLRDIIKDLPVGTIFKHSAKTQGNDEFLKKDTVQFEKTGPLTFKSLGSGESKKDYDLKDTKSFDFPGQIQIIKKPSLKEDDLKQLSSDSNEIRNSKEIIDAAKELSDKSSDKNSLIKNAKDFFKLNGIKDSEKITHIVDLAYANIKKRSSQLNEEDGGGDPDVATGDPTETSSQNDTIKNLYQLGLGYAGKISKKKKKMYEGKQSSSSKRAVKFLENAEKHLVKVNEELKKAIEHEDKIMREAEEQDGKATEKFSVQVRHELGKMLKDKSLVDAAMKKYDPVMKHVKGEHDAKKIAKSILATSLKAKK